MRYSIPKTKVAFTFLFFALCITASAQYAWSSEDIDDVQGSMDVTLSLGATNFLGDLGGTPGEGEKFVKDFLWKTVRPHFGASFSYYPKNWLKVGAGIAFTTVNGADSLIDNKGGQERWRWYRNTSFRSRIFEASVAAEVYPLTLIDKYHTMRKLNPFVGLGVGLFHFNPKAPYQGQWVELQPLHLEGQGFAEYPERKEYKLTQVFLPITLGVKYYLSNTVALSMSALFRQTFTDYIDDVSTTYIDPALFDKYLSPSQAVLAKALYSRALRPEKVKPNVEKADAKDRDNYVSVLFSITFMLKGGERIHYPR